MPKSAGSARLQRRSGVLADDPPRKRGRPRKTAASSDAAPKPRFTPFLHGKAKGAGWGGVARGASTSRFVGGGGGEVLVLNDGRTVPRGTSPIARLQHGERLDALKENLAGIAFDAEINPETRVNASYKLHVLINGQPPVAVHNTHRMADDPDKAARLRSLSLEDRRQIEAVLASAAERVLEGEADE